MNLFRSLFLERLMVHIKLPDLALDFARQFILTGFFRVNNDDILSIIVIGNTFVAHKLLLSSVKNSDFLECIIIVCLFNGHRSMIFYLRQVGSV